MVLWPGTLQASWNVVCMQPTGLDGQRISTSSSIHQSLWSIGHAGMAMAIYHRRRLHHSRRTDRLYRLPRYPGLTTAILFDGKGHCIGQGEGEKSQHPTTRKAGIGCLQAIIETVAYLGFYSLLRVSHSILWICYGDAN